MEGTLYTLEKRVRVYTDSRRRTGEGFVYNRRPSFQLVIERNISANVFVSRSKVIAIEVIVVANVVQSSELFSDGRGEETGNGR